MKLMLVALAAPVLLACGGPGSPGSDYTNIGWRSSCGQLTTNSKGTTLNLTKITPVYSACDGTVAFAYVRGKVDVAACVGAPEWKDLIMGTDANGKAVNGWISTP